MTCLIYPDNSNRYHIATKLNKIELSIQPHDSTQKDLLDQILNNFDVSLAHSNQSYFNFNNRIYQFDSNSESELTIIHSFEKEVNDNSTPIRVKKVSQELAEGGLI